MTLSMRQTADLRKIQFHKTPRQHVPLIKQKTSKNKCPHPVDHTTGQITAQK